MNEKVVIKELKLANGDIWFHETVIKLNSNVKTEKLRFLGHTIAINPSEALLASFYDSAIEVKEVLKSTIIDYTKGENRD